ncbi:MAG: type III pantothenate kinase [Akkermansiaceae bacterium]
MAWLLIDNSNTRTKVQLGNSEGLLGEKILIPTKDLHPTNLAKLTESLGFSEVVVASVVPEKADVLIDFFQNSHPLHQISHQSPLGFGFDLDSPEQIGQDRLANAVALKHRYGAPSIAIDFGTANTFSIISEQGNFSGGSIAPGMAVMMDYLSANTAVLPKIEPIIQLPAIGKTTAQAINSGLINGYRGMIREILQQLISEVGGKPTLVGTGGGAEFAQQILPEIQEIDPDLTLEGLRLVADKVFSTP